MMTSVIQRIDNCKAEGGYDVKYLNSLFGKPILMTMKEGNNLRGRELKQREGESTESKERDLRHVWCKQYVVFSPIEMKIMTSAGLLR